MLIERCHAMQVLDSRGNPTIKAYIELDCGIVCSSIAPSGASTGSMEALELRDGGSAFMGKGVQKAVKNINTKVSNEIKGMDADEPADIDSILCDLDGTVNKSRLGANATVAVSMAAYHAAALSWGMPLYQFISDYSGSDICMPVPFMNVINGGKHAGSGLAVQEFMIAPIGFKTFSEALQAGAEVYQTLKILLKKDFGPQGINVGDEGGFAPDIESTDEALQILEMAIDEAGYRKKVKLASDAAASEFYSQKKKTYHIDGLDADARELEDYWAAIVKSYPLISLEDPFYEKDMHAYAALKKKASGKCQIVGDDMTVTNLKMVKKAHKLKAMSALLLKVNQIGTVSEAIEAADYCKDNGMGVMVSHRSGESEDTTIADLAVGLGTGQIKSGAPCRGERTAKYNRLLEIEHLLGKKAKFLGERKIVKR